MRPVPIANPEIYLSRMAAPLLEKLKVRAYIPQNAERVLDVGCADGAVTFGARSAIPAHTLRRYRPPRVVRPQGHGPRLRGRWQKDFGFTDGELGTLKSTAFLVARKS